MWIDYNTLDLDTFMDALEDDGFEDDPSTPMPLKCCSEGCEEELMVYHYEDEVYICPKCGRTVCFALRGHYAIDCARGIRPPFHKYDL